MAEASEDTAVAAASPLAATAAAASDATAASAAGSGDAVAIAGAGVVESSAAAAGGASASASASGFTFEVAARERPALHHRDRADMWRKWNLDQRRAVVDFRFSGTDGLTPAGLPAFLLDLFNSPIVRRAWQPFTRRGDPVALAGRVADVRFSSVPTTQLSMAFFDRLTTAGIVAGDGGYIRKRLDEIVEGVTVADELRDLLVNPESEHADLFTEGERAELLFRLLRWVVIGGSMSQFEVRHGGGGDVK